MNNDLNQNINNNVTPQPMPNGTPVPPQPVPNPVEQPVQPQPMNTMNTGMAQPMSNPNPMPQEPMMNQAPAQPMGNPMPEQPMNPQQMNMQQPTMQQPTMAQPEPPKEKKKSNPVLIFLMFVALIGGAGYFGYNYFIANKDVNSNTNNSGTTETTNEEINYESIAKEKMPVMIILSHRWNYCGKANKEDTFKQNDSNNIERTYWASIDFKSIEELKSYMNSLMSEELIKKNYEFDNQDYFIEKDGKLYYQPSNKDCGYDFVYDDSIINEKSNYQISNESDNSFDVVVTLPYTVSCDEKENTLTAKATFTKEGNNWIISKYEDDAIYQVKY